MDENISYEFDSFRLIPAERQLLRDENLVALPPKAFDTLLILVQNHGHALKKDDLMKQVWPDSFVEESNLNHYISVLRKALANGNGEEYVETVRGHGFRFKANVRRVNGGPDVLVHRQTRTRLVVKREESQRVTSATRTHVVRNRLTPLRVIALVLLVLMLTGAVAGFYFGLMRPTQSRVAGVPSVGATKKGLTRNENPAAREAYLRGQYFLSKRTADDVMKAAFEFRRAREIDPDYPLAYVGLADCMLLGAPTNATTENAKDLALKAIALDDAVGEAHATLAYYLGAVDWNWLEAEREFEKSISLNPNYARARHWHAYNLASLGRMDEAMAEIKKARDLDPLSIIINTDVGHILYLAERYDEAIAQYLTTLNIEPNFRVTRWRLGEAYAQAHRYEEAVTELEKAISLESGSLSALELWIAYAAAINGHRSEALKIISRRQGDAEARSHSVPMALAYAGLGDSNTAFMWLEKALQLHDGQLALIKVEPMLKSLRSDPRYAELLRRMNLPT